MRRFNGTLIRTLVFELLISSGDFTNSDDYCAANSCSVDTEVEYSNSGHSADQETAAMSRVIGDVVESKEQDEGVGARVRRSIGNSGLRNVDPFLMLDEFKVKKPAGFPDHPHRGFETVTYMLEGAFRHEDFVGHVGVINPGDLQWMTAGRGILHCEMPEGEGLAHGLQLWVNLAKDHKMVEPAYQELLNKDIPKVSKDGVTVKVIAGESMGTKSPVYTRTPTMYLDFKMEKGTTLDQTVPEGWSGFVYVLSGTAMFGPDDKAKKGPPHHTLVLGPGNSLHVKNEGSETCRFVLIAGKPLKQPIVQYVQANGVDPGQRASEGALKPGGYETFEGASENILKPLIGPFVMNTNQEIQQAMADYQTGRNGFENAQSWQSSVYK